MACIFCKIVNSETPTEILWEDEKHIAFLSIFPNTPGFTVVATKEHKPSYVFTNSDQTLIELTLATKKVAKYIDDAFEDVARCGMFYEGYGVDHLHSKLFPMHSTANMKEWKNIEKTNKEVFFDKYPGFITTQESRKADDKELKRIADKIRKVTGYNKT